MTPEAWIEIVGGNLFAAIILWLYIKQGEEIKSLRKEHQEQVETKDKEIKELNDSINSKVIALLDEQRKYLTDNNGNN